MHKGGGIWAEGESDDMFLGGVRWELVEAIKSIKPPYIRYPGGCFADGYHWQDGIGPREDRPVRKNLAWASKGEEYGPLEDNHFGTDEFMALCEEVGAGAMITINFGSGTPEEAAAWVEYCNGSTQTKWGAERAKNGHPKPYNVKYWFVGNETFRPGEIGGMGPKKYVKVYKEFVRAMRAVDPDVKCIAVGNLFPKILWNEDFGMGLNRKVLQGVGEDMDYLSIHQYVPGWNAKTIMRYQLGGQKTSGKEEIYYDVLSMINRYEYVLERSIQDLLDYSPPGKLIQIAFDEWNLWFEEGPDLIQSNYNLRDGLWTASVLNLLHRLAPHVPIANYAQLVNCLGMIWSDKDGTFLTAAAQVFKLYANHAGDQYLASEVDCSNVPHKSELPVLDFSATRSSDRTILFMVNRHFDSELDVSCVLKGCDSDGNVAAWEIHHPDPVRYNTVESPNDVTITEKRDGVSVQRISGDAMLGLRMKPHSIVCVEYS